MVPSYCLLVAGASALTKKTPKPHHILTTYPPVGYTLLSVTQTGHLTQAGRRPCAWERRWRRSQVPVLYHSGGMP